MSAKLQCDVCGETFEFDTDVALCCRCGQTLCEMCAEASLPDWHRLQLQDTGGYACNALFYDMSIDALFCGNCADPEFLAKTKQEEEEECESYFSAVRHSQERAREEQELFRVIEDDPDNPVVLIRRQWNDYRVAATNLKNLEGLHWTDVSGGVNSKAPRKFLHGYVLCTEVEGSIAHSCRHGMAPHSIKVCVTKKGNKDIWEKIAGNR